MTQPDPYAAQRAAALETWTAYEQALYEGYFAMMSQWLGQVAASVLNAGTVSLALMPDPYAVFSRSQLWRDLSAEYTADVVRTVLAPVYERILGPDVLFDSRPFVQNFIAQMTNTMQDVPDQVYALLGDIVHAATVNGATVPDVQAQMAELLKVAGTDRWQQRAQTVARTMLHTAYSGGTHDAFAAVVEADPDTEWVHRWLATEDEHTRPWHRAADLQEQPWGTPFTVGPEQLMFPGDPTGSAANVINCRCVELLEVKGEPTRMDNRQFKTVAASAAALLDDPHEWCSLVACRLTGKPGLCKGQHRGGYEPGTDLGPGGDKAAVAQSAIASQQIKAVADRIRASMATWTPEQRARATTALARYQRALSAHQRIIQGNRDLDNQRAQAEAAAKRQAARDAKEQDALDRKKKATARKIGDVARGLKPYQTSTKI